MSEKPEPTTGSTKSGRRKANKAKRLSLMFRLSEPVHAKVWEAAEANGRSLSEELEHRVVQSVEMPSVIQAAASAAAEAAVRQSEAASKNLLLRVWGGEDGHDAALAFALHFGRIQRAVDEIVQDETKWYDSPDKMARIEDALQSGTKRFLQGLAKDLKTLRPTDKKFS